MTYALCNLEPRGRLFIVPGDPVYEGMIIGEHSRGILTAHQRRSRPLPEAERAILNQ